MATSNLNSIRVRLYFDYPPPATSDCRMCWLLVDLNKCRVVADLSSIIKEKFGYSRKTILDLFIEDCYLPTTESIYIVRDNDSIRVKVSGSVFVNEAETYQNCVAHNSKTKKRDREDEMQICVTQGSSKKTKLDVQINGSAPADSGKKKKKRKKKNKEKQSANNPATPQKTIPVKEQASQSSNRKNTSSDKTSRAKNQESTSSSSDSSEDESHSKASPPKPKPKLSGVTKKPAMPAQKKSSSSDSDSSDNTVKPAARKSSNSVQPLFATPKPSTSTNSKIPPQTPKQRKMSTDSSSSSSPSQRKPSAKKSQVDPQPSLTSPQSISASGSKKPQEEAESSDSDASEIELVIKKPNLQGMGLNIAGLSSSTSEAADRPKGNMRGQERGRGRGGNRGSGGFGRAKGTPWKQDFNYKYENGEHQKRRDLLTNESFILQNPPEPEPERETAPKRDYTTLPLLAAPPAVGQTIAFKLLELTENYTPEVSDYKEAKIIAFNPQTKMLELELFSRPHAPAEPGKFDLVYENPDGSESVEYAVTHGSQLTERWDSLLEPRLIVENVG